MPAVTIKSETGHIAPVINSNGTAKADLLDGLSKAVIAVDVAVRMVQSTIPHGRDYQHDPSGEQYRQARKEHETRVAKLAEVKEELYSIWFAIDGQGS